MSLSDYKRKRKFDQTPEPAGSARKQQSKRLEFVVHKHDASHLHYDFRLEMDGTLKSWAVPKGPSLNPDDKRLAMMVEDHPFEYRKFEGVIPEGNYGAGNVIIWDNGWYEPRTKTASPEKTLLRQLADGHLTFIVHGQKLNGEFALIKNEHMQKNAWLLVKKKDKQASDADITKQDRSVLSGKTVDKLNQAELDLSGLPSSSIPEKVKPMLATLTKEPFNDERWLYEIKWDGYRAIAAKDEPRALLYSRNGIDFAAKYPEIADQVSKLNHRVVLDGEIVVVDAQGQSRFEWLQNRSRDKQGTLVYYAFDILWCDGHDLRGQPLIERKKILQTVLSGNDRLRYSDHIAARGVDFFKMAQAQSLEGIIAKAADSTYQQGRRSRQWLKIKTHLRQEAVIGGFTEPRGSRKHIGALVLGVYDKGKLIYVGHTGGGIPAEQMPALRRKMEKAERRTSPFANKFRPNAPVHWIRPELVCEVSFSEWTSAGHMRQPIFAGLRIDKDPQKVRRESPISVKAARPAARATRKPVERRLEFTHLDKVFFPKPRYTKGDLVTYYQDIADLIMPYLKDRPHNLLRQPNGIRGQSFFQKDMENHPTWIKTLGVYSESNAKNIHYLVCDSAEALLYMVQLGSIEINPWNSRAAQVNKPDWIVMDLDPEDIAFERVVEVALKARQVLEELNIQSYPKTSGKTGIHIYIPLAAKYDYSQARQFGEILANMIHQAVPEITSLERSPKKRQKKIYIDFLQNREGQTLAAPYSVRPTETASVSTPLEWSEINKKLKPDDFTIKTIQRRLDRAGDLWRPVLGPGVDIAKILKKLPNG